MRRQAQRACSGPSAALLSSDHGRCSGLPLLQLLLVHHLYQLIIAQCLTWQDSGQFCCLHCFMSFSKFWTLWAPRIEESYVRVMVSSVLNTAEPRSRLNPHRGIRLWVGATVTLIFGFRPMKCTHLLPFKSGLGSLMKKFPMIHNECLLFWLHSIILYTQYLMEVSLGAFYPKLFLKGCHSWQQILFCALMS